MVHYRQERMDCMCMCVHIHVHVCSLYMCVVRGPINVEKANLTLAPFNVPKQYACFGLYTNRNGCEFWLSLPFTLPEWGKWKFLTEKSMWPSQKKRVVSNPTRARYKVIPPVWAINFPGRLKGNRSSHDSFTHAWEQKTLESSFELCRSPAGQGLGRS